MSSARSGRRILVVEDDYLIGEALVDELQIRGMEVIGPAGTVTDALRLAAETTRIDAALLDVNLRGEMAFPIADALRARNVPFAFATGYDDTMIPARYAGVKCYEKPFGMTLVLEDLEELVAA